MFGNQYHIKGHFILESFTNAPIIFYDNALYRDQCTFQDNLKCEKDTLA